MAEDEGFRRGVKRGTAVAEARFAHSVHVDADRLAPGHWYFYRFMVGDQVSPVGRTRTAPARGHKADRLRFLFASCQNWQSGFWPLWAHAPADDPDVVLHLGDYIYEGGAGTGPSIVRPHNGPEIITLDDYRNRYGLYKGDPALQGIHAACPWIVTWDDHEVENNYAGLVPQFPNEAPVPGPAGRRLPGLVGAHAGPHGPAHRPRPQDLPVARLGPAGPLPRARRPPVPQRPALRRRAADTGPTCPDRVAATQTMLGSEQEAWIGAGLAESRATWDVLANQTVMTSLPFAGVFYNATSGTATPRPAPACSTSSGRAGWSTVVLTGDIHAAGAGSLVDENPDGTSGTVAVGTELVGSSISSASTMPWPTWPSSSSGAAPHRLRRRPAAGLHGVRRDRDRARHPLPGGRLDRHTERARLHGRHVHDPGGHPGVQI